MKPLVMGGNSKEKREECGVMGTAGERKTKRQKKRERRAEEAETRDSDGSLSGKLNLSRCYWEENGIEEERRGSEGDGGKPGRGRQRAR